MCLRDTQIFLLEAFHVIIFSDVKSEPRYRLRYRLRSLYQNLLRSGYIQIYIQL